MTRYSLPHYKQGIKSQKTAVWNFTSLKSLNLRVTEIFGGSREI
jgi:hypothetical protein